MNKKIYFITGLGCSGKSTLSERIATKMGIPCFHADNAYALVMNKLNLTQQQVAPLATKNAWDKNTDWGIYKTPETLLQVCYNELFSYLPPERLVLEGEALFFNSRERDLVETLFADYDKRYLFISISYEDWLKFKSRRMDEGIMLPPFMDETEYYRNLKLLADNVPKHNQLIITDPTKELTNPTGGTTYQSDDFSDPKWAVFNFPDLKGKTFFDISCNTGWFCQKASQMGAQVSGLDISWEALDIAMDRNPQGTFYLSKIEDFIPVQKYDYVLCSSAFHYYHHREEQIKKFADMTDNLTLELPLLDTDEPKIYYQGGENGDFCSVVSRGLIESWLKKYFTKVVKIGETIQPNSNNRPVYKCTK